MNLSIAILALAVALITLSQYVPSVTARTSYLDTNPLGNTSGCGNSANCSVSCPRGWTCTGATPAGCGGNCTLNTTGCGYNNPLCSTNCPTGYFCSGYSIGACEGTCRLNTTGCGRGNGCQACGPFRVCLGAQPNGCGGVCSFIFPPPNGTINGTFNTTNGTVVMNTTINTTFPGGDP